MPSHIVTKLSPTFESYLNGTLNQADWDKIWLPLQPSEKKALLMLEIGTNGPLSIPFESKNLDVFRTVVHYYRQVANTPEAQKEIGHFFIKELHKNILTIWMQASSETEKDQYEYLRSLFGLFGDTLVEGNNGYSLSLGKESTTALSSFRNVLGGLYMGLFFSSSKAYQKQGYDKIADPTNKIRVLNKLLEDTLSDSKYDSKYACKYDEIKKKFDPYKNLTERQFIPAWDAFIDESELNTLNNFRDENVGQDYYKKLNAAIEKLTLSIGALRTYGVELETKHRSSKGSVLIELADALDSFVGYLAIDPAPEDFNKLKRQFEVEIENHAAPLASYRLNGSTLLTNILIALTGVGIIILAARLAYTALTKGRPLFFNQKETTTSEDIFKKVTEEFKELEQQMPPAPSKK